MPHRLHSWPLALLLIVAGCAPEQAAKDDAAAPPVQTTAIQVQPDPPFEPSTFMRFIDLGRRRGFLHTAIVTYENADGARADLIAAVHVADPAYYARLKEKFTEYDALLYEMVKPENADVPAPGERSGSGIGFVQRSMTRVLDLQFQLDGIDYRAANFVHADLTREQFAALQKERGESLFSLMMTSMREQMARRRQAQQEGKPLREPSTAELLAALMSDDPRDLKYLLAGQVQDMEAKVAGALGDSVILIERNKACLAVLERELAAGKRNLAVFYGAAHMRDLEHRLVHDLGFRKTEQQWITAWSIMAKEGQ